MCGMPSGMVSNKTDVADRATMKTQQPIIREDDEEHRVLKFVPRTSARPPSRSTSQKISSQKISSQKISSKEFPLSQIPAPKFPAQKFSEQGFSREGYARQAQTSVDDLDNVMRNNMARFEQAPDEPDDFRHRMLANTAAFALTVALTAIGIWLAISIADLRNTQDCVLMGRRDCGRISTPQT